MLTKEPSSTQNASFATPAQDLVTPPPCLPPPVVVQRSADSLYFSRCMQLIWNEVDRLTSLGVIRSEEDKWFFAYRKAVRILEGEE
jgi:hypothetical protein